MREGVMPVDGRAEWAFVGRSSDVDRMSRAVSDHGAVVVAGPAGVGKSRLAREVVARLRGADGGPPAAVVAASRAAAEVPLAALSPLLTDPGSGADALTVRAAVEALRAHPVLLVDDAHHLDRVSATALHQAVSAGGSTVVVTLRTGEPTHDAVTALWKDGLAARVELDALSAAETAVVLEAVLGGPVDGVSARRLFTVTGGNLLWLRHLVEGERTAGRLHRREGRWTWLGHPTLSSALGELLAERIGELSAAEHRVLDLLAWGEPLGLGLLEELADRTAIEDVAERGLIDVRIDGARHDVRWGHPLYGESVRARMSPPRQRRVRGELARALGTTGQRRREDVLRRAVLDLDSDRAPDAELFATAAGQAVELGDTELGVRLFRAARDAGGGFEVAVGLGALAMWLFGGDEADTELARAEALASTSAQRARATQFRVLSRLFLLARPDEAAALLAAAPASPGLHGLRALLALAAGDLPRTGLHLERLAAVDDPVPAARATGGWAAVLLRALGGRGEPLRPLADTAARAATASPETTALAFNIGFAEVVGHGLDGDLTAARAGADRLRAAGGDTALVLVGLYEGRTALDAGRPRTALRALADLRPYYPGHGGGVTAWIELMAAAAAAMAGDAPEATAALERMSAAHHPGTVFLEPQLAWARAWVSATQGATSEAVALLRRTARATASSGQGAIEMLVRHTAVCFGDRTQAAPLTALARSLATPRARLAAAHAQAWASRDAAALEAASTGLEGLGLELLAADAAAQVAWLGAEAGESGRVAGARNRARELARRCEDARTPALVAVDPPVSVSAREREVATLAAQGLTNRQIAARLGVSMRTVESTVYRACQRLGLDGRAALVAVVVPEGLRPV